MIFTELQKDEIRKDFTSGKTVKDLVVLLNKISGMRYANHPHWKYNEPKITIESFNYFLYVHKEKYKTFTISKKSGGVREIKAPHRFLKNMQRLLNECLNACFIPMPTATGFIEGRGILDNAKKHVGKKYVYNIDLKDFFPSINFHRVRAALEKVPPFKLDGKFATIVANLCCHENSLPQGAPTSPTISNFICKKLDAKLYNLSKDMQFSFSRYADDITISCNKNIFTKEFKSLISKIIEEEGFKLNPKKERLQRNHVETKDGYIRQRQEVTGIIVNEKPNVPRRYLRNLRAMLHNWEKHGYDVASQQLEHYYKNEKGFQRYSGHTPALEQVVGGKLEYLGMVRGKEDALYIDFKLRYDSLCMKNEYTHEEIEEIFTIGETKGLKAAMDRFYDKRNLSQDGQ